ncbi:MAG TPA: diguanylate cyclase, partial [Modicisalibacter sp.]|nr:diguanylate cyclase [Modicisalibacter sp.]
ALMVRLAGCIYWHEGCMLGPITISCGIAAYPMHASNPMALARLADRALYAAKEGGRARVAVYA